MSATTGAAFIGKVVTVSAGGSPVHEELYGGRRQRLGSRQSELTWWTVERPKQTNVLAFDPQRLASGGENVQQRRLSEEQLSQHGDRLNHMLAAI